ncbi:MAG: hypothetical protein ACRDGJ_07895, partial [Candidatus Limnocylindria bacterium]
AAVTFIWVQAAPLLIGVVFRLTAGYGSGPTVAAVYALQLDGNYLVAAAAVLGVLLLALRYLGRQPYLAPVTAERPSPVAPVVRYGVIVALTFIVLFGVVTQPIDVVILLPALLVARPLANLVLRSTGLGAQLARLPMPIRLIMGFAVAVAIGWVVVSVLGFQSELSGFFTMVVALAIGYIVMTIFITDASAPTPASATSGTSAAGSGVVTTLVLLIGLLIFLGLPAVALADNGSDHADGWGDAAAAALAAAGAAALVSAWLVAPTFTRDNLELWEQMKQRYKETRPFQIDPADYEKPPHRPPRFGGRRAK